MVYGRVKMELYPYQKEVLEQSKDMKKVAYYWDMGTGKTFVGSEKIKSIPLEEHIVVCQKSKVDDWVDHFIKYYPEYTVIDLTRTNNQVRHNGGNTCVGVINYELFWRRPHYIPITAYSLTLDESSLVGNDKAKVTKFIMSLKPEYLILLSGTPSGGKYEKLWSQLKMLGYPTDKRTYYDKYIVQRTIVTAGGMRLKVPTGTYKNVKHLMDVMKRLNCFFLKTEEVLDLPEQNFVTIHVDSTAQYKKFVKDRIVMIGDKEIVGDTTFTKILGERQLCGQFNLNKLVSFKDTLDSTDDRLIVFYNFKDELEELIKVTGNRPMSFVNGEKRDLTAYENNGDSVTFIQFQAGARGLNLQKANKIVYFSPPLSADLYAQSQKRIHRLGQRDNCFYFKMVTRNSIEEKIYDCLDRGVDYEQRLFEEV